MPLILVTSQDHMKYSILKTANSGIFQNLASSLDKTAYLHEGE